MAISTACMSRALPIILDIAKFDFVVLVVVSLVLLIGRRYFEPLAAARNRFAHEFKEMPHGQRLIVMSLEEKALWAGCLIRRHVDDRSFLQDFVDLMPVYPPPHEPIDNNNHAVRRYANATIEAGFVDTAYLLVNSKALRHMPHYHERMQTMMVQMCEFRTRYPFGSACDARPSGARLYRVQKFNQNVTEPWWSCAINLFYDIIQAMLF